jgi:integrase/recombinase XerD
MRTIRSRMTPLRQRMLEDLQLRNYSPLTIDCYLRCVADFAKHFRTSPEHLGPEQVRTYQLFLVQEKQVAWPSVVQTVCALRFFSRVTLGRPAMLEYIAPPRRPFTLPTILSQAEVAALLTVSRHLKHRAILTTLYAAGLRVSQLCQLQVTDIDSARMVLRVRQGKGQHDRYVMLSPKLLPLLRQYWQQSKPQPWLFPGHPRTRPMTTKAVYLVCRQAGEGRRRTSRRGSIRMCFVTPLRRISSKRGWICAGSNSCWAIAACAVPVATSMSRRMPCTRPPARWMRCRWTTPYDPPATRTG